MVSKLESIFEAVAVYGALVLLLLMGLAVVAFVAGIAVLPLATVWWLFS